MPNVLKANGKTEPFSEEKVMSSIKRAGIPKNLQDQTLIHVKERLHDNISTKEIYHHILEYLDKSPQPFTRSKYSLKQAIMDLGPSGYPFEDFIANILQAQGYKTKIRQILQGECIAHEIDVIAEKDGLRSMIEAKFHNNPGTRSQVHVALYTKARFDDIKRGAELNDAWIVTNTKATSDVKAYAMCKGMKVISWDYPENGSLRDLIEQSGLHPITVLSSLKPANKVNLLNNHIVMCKDICKDPSILNNLPLTHEERERIIDESSYVCSIE